MAARAVFKLDRFVRTELPSALLCRKYEKNCARIPSLRTLWSSSLSSSPSFGKKSERFNASTSHLHSTTSSFHSSTSCSAKDFYKVLGVAKNADPKDVKQAYFKLAKQYHPDSHPNDRNAKEKFQDISEAYDVLSDDDKRREYDVNMNAMAGGKTRSGSSGRGSFTGSDFDAEEIFDRVFGKHSEFAREPEKAQDFTTSSREITVGLTFVEAARGVYKTIDIFYEESCSRCDGKRYEPSSKPIKCNQCMGSGVETISRGPFVLRQTCRHCHGARVLHKDSCTRCKGKGKVTVKRGANIQVPAGVEDGQTIRTNVDGKEYFIHFNVEKSKHFRRSGSDVHSDVQISLSQAVLGGIVRVTGVYDDYRMNVPAGTQSHEYILLKGKGMKRVNSSGYGDHYVHVKIKIPSKMSPEQLALMTAFAESESDVEGTIHGLTEVTLNNSSSDVRRRAVSDDAGYLAEIRRAVGWDEVDGVDDFETR